MIPPVGREYAPNRRQQAQGMRFERFRQFASYRYDQKPILKLLASRNSPSEQVADIPTLGFRLSERIVRIRNVGIGRRHRQRELYPRHSAQSRHIWDKEFRSLRDPLETRPTLAESYRAAPGPQMRTAVGFPQRPPILLTLPSDRQQDFPVDPSGGFGLPRYAKPFGTRQSEFFRHSINRRRRSEV